MTHYAVVRKAAETDFASLRRLRECGVKIVVTARPQQLEHDNFYQTKRSIHEHS